MYKGECTCDEMSVGETVRYVEVCWAEHSNIIKKSEPLKHLFLNVRHSFSWCILLSAHKNPRTSLNEQVKSNALNLFCNGIT